MIDTDRFARIVIMNADLARLLNLPEEVVMANAEIGEQGDLEITIFGWGHPRIDGASVQRIPVFGVAKCTPSG